MTNTTRLEIIREWAHEIRDYCSVVGPGKGGADIHEPYERFESRWREFEVEWPMLNNHAQSIVARIQRVATYDPTVESDYRGRTP